MLVSMWLSKHLNIKANHQIVQAYEHKFIQQEGMWLLKYLGMGA